MEGGANEVRYKIAEFLLKRMHEDMQAGLIPVLPIRLVLIMLKP